MAKCYVFYKHILLRQIYTAGRPGEIRVFLLLFNKRKLNLTIKNENMAEMSRKNQEI